MKPETDEQSNKKQKPDKGETVKLVNAYKSNVKDDYIFCIETGEDREYNEIELKIDGVFFNYLHRLGHQKECDGPKVMGNAKKFGNCSFKPTESKRS